MTVSQELREWAMCDRRADMNSLSHSAWNAMADWRQGNWSGWFAGPTDTRTFALLVACALEDDD